MPESKYQKGTRVALKQKHNLGTLSTFSSPSAISLLPGAVGEIESVAAVLSHGTYYEVEFKCGGCMVICVLLHENECTSDIVDQKGV